MKNLWTCEIGGKVNRLCYYENTVEKRNLEVILNSLIQRDLIKERTIILKINHQKLTRNYHFVCVCLSSIPDLVDVVQLFE